MSENPYAMDDETWEKVIEAVSYLMKDNGMVGGPEDAFSLIKNYWHVLDTPEVLYQYVEEKRDEEKANHKAALEAQLAALEGE